METMTAYCGLDCSQCQAFIATRNDDDAARKKIAREWSEQFGMEMKPEDINCDGCKADSERKIGHCAVCRIRSCGVEKGLENCAFCPEYACDKLAGFLKHAPQARKNLENIKNKA